MPIYYYYTMDVYKDNMFMYTKHCRFVSAIQAFAVIRLWSASNPKSFSYRNINKSTCMEYSIDEKHQCDFTQLYLDLV